MLLTVTGMFSLRIALCAKPPVLPKACMEFCGLDSYSLHIACLTQERGGGPQAKAG